MNNYYTNCIQDIQKLIDQKKYEKALEKLYVELSMPYIPEEHKQVFEMMLHTIQSETASGNHLYTDIDEIKKAFLKEGQFSIKALNSLGRLNLRPYLNELQEILMYDIDDDIKRMILLISLEQELKFKCEITLDQKKLVIDTEYLDNPLSDSHYQMIYKELHEMLVSYDPSFLNLCLDELNMQMMKNFPNINKQLTSDQIIENVNSYMNKG